MKVEDVRPSQRVQVYALGAYDDEDLTGTVRWLRGRDGEVVVDLDRVARIGGGRARVAAWRLTLSPLPPPPRPLAPPARTALLVARGRMVAKVEGVPMRRNLENGPGRHPVAVYDSGFSWSLRRRWLDRRVGDFIPWSWVVGDLEVETWHEARPDRLEVRVEWRYPDTRRGRLVFRTYADAARKLVAHGRALRASTG